jgi:HK97 family phage prohead protease
MTTQPADPQPEGSIRAVPFELVPAGDGLTLEGYAAVFNSPIRVKNRFEDFTETIAPGAFNRAIRANPKPIMQFDHGTHPMLGSIPVASVTSMREDDRGLYVSARMHDNWLTEPVRDAIREGSITGMSFRFTTPDDGVTWSEDRDTRTVTDLDLHELGPVVWPAYTDTTVALRSRQFADAVGDDPDLLKDFSIGLLLANHRDEQPDEPDPTPDAETDARTDDEDVESFVVESPAPAKVEGVRVANPAVHAQALMAVRTDLATQRSHFATHELSDRG